MTALAGEISKITSYSGSDEIKKSLNLFVIIIGTVLTVTIILALIIQNKTSILQGLIILAGLGLMVESIREINQL